MEHNKFDDFGAETKTAPPKTRLFEVFSETSGQKLFTPEEVEAIEQFYNDHPDLKQIPMDKDPHNEAWIQTYTGKKFYPLEPREEDIDITDIAHALSNICRYTGHCRFYSVAQHSVLVSHLCDYDNALSGLLHDASEAYIQDICSSLKKTVEFTFYREIEFRLQGMIYKKFGCPLEPLDVKRADILIFCTEARDLMSPLHRDFKLPMNPLPFKIEPVNPEEAERMFLARFNELTGK